MLCKYFLDLSILANKLPGEKFSRTNHDRTSILGNWLKLKGTYCRCTRLHLSSFISGFCIKWLINKINEHCLSGKYYMSFPISDMSLKSDNYYPMRILVKLIIGFTLSEYIS